MRDRFYQQAEVELESAAKALHRARLTARKPRHTGPTRHTKKRQYTAFRLRVARATFWESWHRLPETRYDTKGAYSYIKRLSIAATPSQRVRMLFD